MPAKALNPDMSDPEVSDIAALASLLKTGRARKAFQAAIKNGTSPILTVTAALSASLVSAAAKEDEFDPLSGLSAVDDLSDFAELCLPGEKYAEAGHDHDALSGSDDHDGHHGAASYLADPFASRFENIYARDHESHDNHGGHEASSVTHLMQSGEGAHGGAHAGAAHLAHGGHESHQADSAEHAAGHAHGGAERALHDHDKTQGHDAHESGHVMAAHQAAGHTQTHAAHQATAAGNAPVDHAAAHNDHAPADEIEDDVIDLDQAIDALVETHQGHHESNSADQPQDLPIVAEAPAAEDHHHHEVTLADMDVTPADDLAAAPPPVI
ncbi:hypothetical protein [Hyphococcus sp.]|uniref:hypothetical protein n=1 Tax=Hyphococcus sp. TaxID=2038636 RepID=UPI0020854823|nr:MAG: hypothetical protein DHS20C04_21210 [Marinicaulis sp.]